MSRLPLILIWTFFASVVAFVGLCIGYSFDPQARQEIALIALKPDNLPIAIMLAIVVFYTFWGLVQCSRNDRLIAEGRKDEVLRDMQR